MFIWLATPGEALPLMNEYQVTQNEDNSSYDAHPIEDSQGYIDIVWTSNSDGGKQKIWFSRSADNLNWSEPVLVTDNSYKSYIPALAEGKDGTLHLGFTMSKMDSNGWDVYYCNSTDLGQTWSTPSKVLGGSNGEAVYGLVAQDQDLWILYGSSSKRYVVRSTDEGKTWSSPVRVTSSNAVTKSSLMLNDDGELLVALTKESDQELYIYGSSDGTSWDLVSNPTLEYTPNNPCLIQDDNGNYWLAMQDDPYGDTEIFLIKSPDLINWSYHNRLTYADGEDGIPGLVTTSDSIYLFWTNSRTDGGRDQVFVGEIEYDEDLLAYDYPCVHVDENGIHYQVVRNADKDILFMTSSDGKDWSEPINVITHESPDSVPQILKGPDSTLYLAFSSKRNSDSHRVWFTRSIDDGMTWIDPLFVAGGSSSSEEANGIEILPDGRLVILFHKGVDSSTAYAYATVSDDNGDTWSSAAKVASSKTKSRNSMTLNEDDELVMVYTKRSDNVFHFLLSADGEDWESVSSWEGASAPLRKDLYRDHWGTYWLTWITSDDNGQLWYSSSTDLENWETPVCVHDHDWFDDRPFLYNNTATLQTYLGWVSDWNGVRQIETMDLSTIPVPHAFIDSIEPSPVHEGETVYLDGHGEYSDGNITGYQWRSDIDGVLSTLASFNTTSLTTATHTIHFKVKADDGNWSQEVSQDLKVNGYPEAMIDSISPNPASDDDEVNFEGHGTDDDGTIAGYNWRSDIDGNISDQATFSISGLSFGNHSIYFRVQDNNGAWSPEVSEELQIVTLPVATIDSVSPNPADPGISVSFQGHGEYEDGEVVGYEWRSDIDGLLSDQDSFDTTSLTIGTHTIHFKVQGDDDSWSTKVSLALRINDPPIATIDTISPNPVEVGDQILFSGSGEDGDGTIAVYRWRSDLDGNLSVAASFYSSTLVAGNHTIYLSVQDNDGAWSAEDSRTLRVNLKPIAVIDSITPNPARYVDEVNFTGHGEDQDGTITGYNWRSHLDGYLAASPQFSFPDLTGGAHTIYFRVQDNEGSWSDEVSTTLWIVLDPNATIDYVSPSPASEGELVHFSGSGEATFGNITDYRWRSSINGVLSVEASFLTRNLSGGYHLIHFSVKDEFGSWSDEAVIGLQVTTRPIAFIDSIFPSSASPGDVVYFSGHGEDLEGAIESYLWYSSIDGPLSYTSSFSTSSLSGGNHNISFTVWDDQDGTSLPVHTTLVINTDPTALIDTITPSPAERNEKVRLVGIGKDQEGPIARYQWKSSENGFIGNTSVLQLTNLSMGHHILNFRVQDSFGIWSSTAIGELWVYAMPEAQAETNLNGTVMTGIEVEFIGTGWDADGHPVKYEWDFDGNGVFDWSSDDSGLVNHTYLKGGDFEARFRVTDNDGFTTSATVSVVVEAKDQSEPPGDDDDGGGFLPGPGFPGVVVILFFLTRFRHRRCE